MDYGLSGQQYDDFVCLGKKCKKRREERRKIRTERKRARTEKRQLANEEVRISNDALKKSLDQEQQDAQIILDATRQAVATAQQPQPAIAAPVPVKAGVSPVVVVFGALLIGGAVFAARAKAKMPVPAM